MQSFVCIKQRSNVREHFLSVTIISRIWRWKLSMCNQIYKVFRSFMVYKEATWHFSMPSLVRQPIDTRRTRAKKATAGGQKAKNRDKEPWLLRWWFYNPLRITIMIFLVTKKTRETMEIFVRVWYEDLLYNQAAIGVENCMEIRWYRFRRIHPFLRRAIFEPSIILHIENYSVTPIRQKWKIKISYFFAFSGKLFLLFFIYFTSCGVSPSSVEEITTSLSHPASDLLHFQATVCPRFQALESSGLKLCNFVTFVFSKQDEHFHSGFKSSKLFHFGLWCWVSTPWARKTTGPWF